MNVYEVYEGAYMWECTLFKWMCWMCMKEHICESLHCLEEFEEVYDMCMSNHRYKGLPCVKLWMGVQGVNVYIIRFIQTFIGVRWVSGVYMGVRYVSGNRCKIDKGVTYM